MRVISLSEIKGKEVLGADIYDEQGRILLNRGIAIKLSYIDRLVEHGIEELYIEDEISEGIIPENVVMMQARQEAKNIIKQEAKRLVTKNDISVAHINKVIDLIVNDILSNIKNNLVTVKDLRVKDDNLFAHSINVAIMSTLLCQKAGFSYQKINNTVTGCLLHDIGKLFLPEEINNKDVQKLTAKELEQYKLHARIGYEMFLDNVDINPTTRVTILMHHEHLDGSGFPDGISGRKIHESARICSICNCFDEMVNGKKRGKLLNVSDAVEYLTAYAGSYFDEELVNDLIKSVPIYPVGSIVLLSDGCLAIVAKNESVSVTRPVVRVFFDYTNKRKIPYQEIDLMKNLSLNIKTEIKGNIRKLLES